MEITSGLEKNGRAIGGIRKNWEHWRAFGGNGEQER